MQYFSSRLRKNNFVAAIWKVVLPYVVFASLWILVSDAVVVSLCHDLEQINAVSTLKGGAFVIVTALLLSVLLRRLIARRDMIEGALQARIRVQEKLEAQLLEAQKVAHLGFYQLDIESGIWTSSEVLDEIFGIDNDFSRTVAGWIRLLHPEDRAEMENYFLTIVLTEKQLFDREYRIVREVDNQVRWVHGKGVVESDAAGNPIRMFGTIQDITDYKLIELNLQNRNAEMESFINTVSHDLKSPLITIKTFLSHLEKDLAEGVSGKVEQDIKYIDTAADKLERMLSELLEVTRICRVGNPKVLVTFRELAAEALDAVAGRIVNRGVEIILVGKDVTFYGDRPRLVEIWQNLIENAVKYMGEQVEPRIEIGAQQCGPETVFFVRDNGIGLSPGNSERIFDLFVKLETASEGSGLGLALVKRIVQLYQGNIWVESSGEGKGSTFSFTLPAAYWGGTAPVESYTGAV